MLKRCMYLIFVLLLVFGNTRIDTIPKVYAQGNTKVIVTADMSECYVGDTVKVSIQAQNVVDLFGLQFTIRYDPTILEMQGEDINFSGGYTVFGGKTVDKHKGILTYPLINNQATDDHKDNESIGYVNFKALKKAPVTITMDNIKAVNKNSVEINYNTQSQAVFSVLEKAVTEPNNPEETGNGSEPQNNNGTEGGNADNSNQGNSKNNSNDNVNQDNSANNQLDNTVKESENTADTTDKSDRDDGLTSDNNSSDNELTVTTQPQSKFSTTLLIILLIMIVGSTIFAFIHKKVLKASAADMLGKIKKSSKEV